MKNSICDTIADNLQSSKKYELFHIIFRHKTAGVPDDAKDKINALLLWCQVLVVISSRLISLCITAISSNFCQGFFAILSKPQDKTRVTRPYSEMTIAGLKGMASISEQTCLSLS